MPSEMAAVAARLPPLSSPNRRLPSPKPPPPRPPPAPEDRRGRLRGRPQRLSQHRHRRRRGRSHGGKDILKSVGAAIPELKPHIEKELAGYGLTLPPVANTLDLAPLPRPAPVAPPRLSPACLPPMRPRPGHPRLRHTTGNSEPNTSGPILRAGAITPGRRPRFKFPFTSPSPRDGLVLLFLRWTGRVAVALESGTPCPPPELAIEPAASPHRSGSTGRPGLPATNLRAARRSMPALGQPGLKNPWFRADA
jgi:hypothetical protein